jgi:hypothetical protein
MADLKISALPASTTPLAGTEVLPIVQSSTTKQVTVANLTAGRTVGAGTLLMNNTSATGVFAGEIGMPNSTGIRWRNGANDGYYNVMYLDGSNIVQVASAGISTVFGGSVTVGATATLTNGNLVIGTAGKGIDFSADGQAAGMTSELLDDYEEGTWTPSFVGSGSYPWTFTITSSVYTKIGRLVYLNCYGTMTASADTTPDVFYIGGVPFIPADCKLVGQVAVESVSDTIYFLVASNLIGNAAIIPSTLTGNTRSFSVTATYSV